MNAGITAGAISAIIAVLVSLPLRSPDDALLNSASVGIASLLVGLLSGLMWRMLINTEKNVKNYVILWAVSSVTVGSMLISAFAVQLDNLVPFALPLTIIVCIVTGVLTPVFGRDPSPLKWWAAPAAIVLTLALAIPLAEVGDQESGMLTLPPKSGLVHPISALYL